MSKRGDPLRRRGGRDRRGHKNHLELIVLEANGTSEGLSVGVALHPMLSSEMDREEYDRMTALTKDLMVLVGQVVIRTCNRDVGTSFKMEDATVRYELPDGQTLGPFPESEF